MIEVNIGQNQTSELGERTWPKRLHNTAQPNFVERKDFDGAVQCIFVPAGEQL